jgi:hypothetical protein
VGLAKGIFGPIAEQIDPLHMGEAWRSMAVAKEYGTRLLQKGKNMAQDDLEDLISGYPSHGFVIDRIEAVDMFERVRESTVAEQKLADLLGSVAISPVPRAVVNFVNEEAKEEQEYAANNQTGEGSECQADAKEENSDPAPQHQAHSGNS